MQMKKNHEIRVKVTQQQYEKIKSKAESVGMSLSSFLRMLGLRTNPIKEDI